MTGYRKLISEKNFLKVRLRARQLMGNGTDLIAILYKDRKLIFKTASGTYGKKVIWTQTVEISDATLENILAAKSFKDVETLLRDSDLKVHCNCPAFLFWGYKYMAWKRGYGLEKEIRRPRVRNPYQQGYLCFAPETKVLTATGYKPIKDINPGDKVFTHKGRLQTVSAVSSHLSDTTVSVRYGKTVIQCTPNHTFLACPKTTKSNASTSKFNAELAAWLPASALTKGAYLVAPFLSLEHSIQVPVREAFFAGLYASDGTLSVVPCKATPTVGGHGFRVKGSMRVALDASYISNYQQICSEYSVPCRFTTQESVYGKCSILHIADNAIRQRCFDLVNFTNSTLKQEKYLSSDILSWDEQAQKEFIRGFFLGDGTLVNGGGQKGSNSVYFTLFNTNKSIMEMLLLLLKQWYDVHLGSYCRRPFEEYGHVISPKRMYYIRLTGSQAGEFAKLLGPSIILCKSFGSKPCRFTNYKLRKFIVDDTIITPKIVKEVYASGQSVVYNLQVEEDESYIVEDVAVHNCKHLYLVLSLYPFWAKALAKKFKDWSSTKEGALNSQNTKFNSPIMNQSNRKFGEENKPDEL